MFVLPNWRPHALDSRLEHAWAALADEHKTPEQLHGTIEDLVAASLPRGSELDDCLKLNDIHRWHFSLGPALIASLASFRERGLIYHDEFIETFFDTKDDVLLYHDSSMRLRLRQWIYKESKEEGDLRGKWTLTRFYSMGSNTMSFIKEGSRERICDLLSGEARLVSSLADKASARQSPMSYCKSSVCLITTHRYRLKTETDPHLRWWFDCALLEPEEKAYRTLDPTKELPAPLCFVSLTATVSVRTDDETVTLVEHNASGATHPSISRSLVAFALAGKLECLSNKEARALCSSSNPFGDTYGDIPEPGEAR